MALQKHKQLEFHHIIGLQDVQTLYSSNKWLLSYTQQLCGYKGEHIKSGFCQKSVWWVNQGLNYPEEPPYMIHQPSIDILLQKVYEPIKNCHWTTNAYFQTLPSQLKDQKIHLVSCKYSHQ